MNRRFHPEFENDLISAARFYERQRSGLGAEFVDEAEQAVATVMGAPRQWPPGWRESAGSCCPGFPISSAIGSIPNWTASIS